MNLEVIGKSFIVAGVVVIFGAIIWGFLSAFGTMPLTLNEARISLASLFAATFIIGLPYHALRVNDNR